MAKDFKIQDHKLKMEKTFNVFLKELSSLRTGRANVSMLDIIKVDVYGQKMPINQLGTVSAPEARLLTIQVWDQNNVALIDSALRKSELAVNPQIDGQLLRIPIPDLTEERRMELKKIMKGLAEKCKISIRSIRREANDSIKDQVKNKEVGEDQSKSFEKQIQTITDDSIDQVEKTLEKKEKEIMSV